MKKLICANQATYDVCEETVCYPSGSANARNYLELWLPQDAMSFDEFEALCKNSAAMASVALKQTAHLVHLQHQVFAKAPKRPALQYVQHQKQAQ